MIQFYFKTIENINFKTKVVEILMGGSCSPELMNSFQWLFFEGLASFQGDNHTQFSIIKKTNQNNTFSIGRKVEMEKIGQNSSSSKPSQCSFCFNSSEEVRMLLRATFLKVRKMLQLKKYAEMLPTQENTGDSAASFNRLIRILFQKQQFEIKFSKNCLHSRLRNLFRQKLKCRSDQLELVIEQLCDKMARRNYQLEIISLQIKHVQNSVIQLQDSKDLSTKTRKASDNSLSEQQKSPSYNQAVKIEEGQQQKQLLQVCQPTDANYHPSFDAIPFSYNIIFYGAPYYQ